MEDRESRKGNEGKGRERQETEKERGEKLEEGKGGEKWETE